jgi:urease accessory protein
VPALNISVAIHTKSSAAAGQAPNQSGRDWVTETVLVLEQRLAPNALRPDLRLPLTADERTVLRGRRRTGCGRDVLLQLPRDQSLQPGDQLCDADGITRVEVTAAPEALLRVQAATPLDLMQAAYHLGNRHVALELHEQELFLLDDSVLEDLLKSRGLMLSRCVRPFSPDGGAYGVHQHG